MKRLLLIFGICVLLVVGCQPGGAARDYSGPYGGPLDTLREAKELIRKGNELADRSKALFDRAERDGKISVDIRLPKPNLQSRGPVKKEPVTNTCPGGVCPLVPEYPKQPAKPTVTQPAAPSCGNTYCRPRVFSRWRR